MDIAVSGVAEINPAALGKVIRALLRNAVEASSADGRIDVRARSIVLSPSGAREIAVGVAGILNPVTASGQRPRGDP